MGCRFLVLGLVGGFRIWVLCCLLQVSSCMLLVFGVYYEGCRRVGGVKPLQLQYAVF